MTAPPPVKTLSGKGNLVDVGIWGFALHPSTVRIAPGTTVAWTNHDSTEHNAAADDGTSFDTGTIPPGEAKAVTFTDAGTYGYHCSLHPFKKGTVVVK